MLDTENSRPLVTATNDWKYSIQVIRWLLKPIGAWPLTLCETTREKLNCTVLMIISCSLLCFVLVPSILSTFLMHTDFITKIRMISTITCLLTVTAKRYILIVRNKDICECLLHVRMDWDRVALTHEKDRRIMLDSAKTGRRLSIICIICMFSAGTFFLIMPIYTKKMEVINNETVRSPIFPIYRGLFDPRTSPFFEIVQFLQILAGYVAHSLTVSIHSLVIMFIMHMCGQIRILMLKLENIIDNKKNKNACNREAKRFGDIVKSHIRIIGFISRIEDLFNKICFIDVVGGTFNICFQGFCMMTEWQHRKTLGTITFCMMVVSVTFNIFILCYLGECLTEQCMKIGAKSYMIDWYYLSGRKALGLILIMAMSNATMRITAGKFVDLSLTNFCSVVNTAMAYLNLLRTLLLRNT